MNPRIKELITESILVKQQILENKELLETIEKVATLLTTALKGGKKVLFCGNGGSAADAQHLACELSGRFYLDREPLYAEALHVNSSAMTSIANDYSFAEVYARLLKSKGREGDILIAMSTSGNSPNILRAIEEAKKRSIHVVGMTNATGGKMGKHCDYLLRMPTLDTPRCQEAHMMVGHLLCEMVETAIFKPLT